MPQPLVSIYSFPVFQSREQFEAVTGQKADPWNPDDPIKIWADKEPSNIHTDDILGDVVTYAPTYKSQGGRPALINADGTVRFGSTTISVDLAKKYNFPPPGGVFPMVGEGGVTKQNQKFQQIEVPVPVTLPAGARVVQDLTAGAIVYLAGEVIPDRSGQQPAGLSATDRADIQTIKADVAAIRRAVVK